MLQFDIRVTAELDNDINSRERDFPLSEERLASLMDAIAVDLKAFFQFNMRSNDPDDFDVIKLSITNLQVVP